MLTTTPLVTYVLATIFAALAATAVTVALRGRGRRAVPAPAPQDDDVVFLFEGTTLADATRQAEDILSRAARGASDWSRVLAALTPHYPELPETLERIDQDRSVELRSRDGFGTLRAAAIGDRIRIAIEERTAVAGHIEVEKPVYRSMIDELETLRAAADELPFPLWRQNADDRVTWVNLAYQEAARIVCPEVEPGSWPPPALFSAEILREIKGEKGARRCALPTGPNRQERWYECRATPVGEDTLYSAVNIDATVAAEKQLREFMQTLTKTFSHLTTGLAVFDRHRQLALFNPALTDLTGLPIDFLAGRPTLYSFLDRLRDKRMIPEPKDYGSWRRQISELEAAATDGTYSETWSLPDNRTYRVTGRPHPGGAVAFLFEDISAEISLTRRFRSELELGQAVIDALDQGVVVFTPDGTLSMVNQAYQDLWESDLGDRLELPSVTEVSRLWMARSRATPFWGDLRDFVLHTRQREVWDEAVDLKDGTRLRCRVVPLTGGSTMVQFAQIVAAPRDEPLRTVSG